MSKILDLLIKYLGLPILERIGRFIYKKIDEYIKDRRIKKEQKKKKEAVENAKTPDDIKTSHRNNKL